MEKLTLIGNILEITEGGTETRPCFNLVIGVREGIDKDGLPYIIKRRATIWGRYKMDQFIVLATQAGDYLGWDIMLEGQPKSEAFLGTDGKAIGTLVMTNVETMYRLHTKMKIVETLPAPTQVVTPTVQLAPAQLIDQPITGIKPLGAVLPDIKNIPNDDWELK